MRTLEGKTALVVGGGEEIGRAIALALSARGVRIVVAGENERDLGLTIGELVFGGGKGRHVVGDPADPAALTAAAARAREVFGPLDIVVAAAGADGAGVDPRAGASNAFATLHPLFVNPGRLVAVTRARADAGSAEAVRHDAARAAVRELARSLSRELRRARHTADFVDAAADVAPEEIAEAVVLLAGRSSGGITGQTVLLGTP
ncbi:MAG: idnO [Labilithrix sp.]|nr:idnO [Labilithrix sp.]